jgi:hypothetical protein
MLRHGHPLKPAMGREEDDADGVGREANGNAEIVVITIARYGLIVDAGRPKIIATLCI